MMKISELLSLYPDKLWSLAKQSGVTHVVSRLPLDKDGYVSFDFFDLLHLKKRYEDFGFKLEVIEPGLNWQMNKMKLGVNGGEKEIEECILLIKNMGSLGIPVLCYNFMAHFNWIRTSLSVPSRGGALVTGYDNSLLFNAPITEFGEISEELLWNNLKCFLEKVVPVAEEAKVRIAIHPDDPPVSQIRGISRIITSSLAIKKAINLVPSKYCGITFCQGTFATANENIYELIKEFGSLNKIFFVHFRDIIGNAQNFVETFHDDGKTDMLRAISEYKKIGFDGPIRIDHVPSMAGENNAEPGYGETGRVFALGYLKGLLENSKYETKK